jgi:hypothetical protein
VSGAGDVNNDGIDDLIIGAFWADPDGLSNAGESYVVFGSSSGFSASLDLAYLDGTNGLQINGVDAGDDSGQSVSGAGDVNGDGIDDLIIGAPDADPDGLYKMNNSAGISYVVFGQPNSSPEVDEIEELIDEVEDIAPALAEPLERVLALLTDDNPNNDSGACGLLEAFASQVIAAERRGDLTEEDAEEMLEDAEEISDDLGCS